MDEPAVSVDPEVIVSFADGEALITHARTGRTFKANPQTLLTLGAAADRSGSELQGLEAAYGQQELAEALERLQAEQLVVTGTADAGLASRWRDWGPAAWLLHRLSTDVSYAVTADEQTVAASQLAEAEPPPLIYRCRCGRDLTVELPHPRGQLGPPLSDVLLARRTCRAFTHDPISMQELADLLFYTAGWLFREEVQYVGPVFKKCAPSPGARHTIEIYPIVTRCSDAEPGVYHYCVEHHRLVRVSTRAQELANTALPGTPFFSDAPVVFLLTCVAARLMWKYKTPRAYRHAHLEAGHYCQNLVLCATALGLGAFQTGALADTVIHETLGIDGESEFVIYAAGAGHAVAEPSPEGPVAVSPRLAHLTRAAGESAL